MASNGGGVSIRIAILLSGRHGRGSNMEAIARACAEGHVAGRVVLVLGNHGDSPALARARALGLPVRVLPSPGKAAPAEDEAAYADALRALLEDVAPDLICLAGYLRRLPTEIVGAWAGRIMNTHPALLPAFGGRGMYGLRVHQAALDYGVKVSGCTVHFVDESYDTGPIILQSAVPVREDDTAETLAVRVLAAEHEAFPRAVALFAEDRLRLSGRRVLVSDSP
ncbi:MAG: phosphoribosylglycinamide formyltransferase [Armatimonadetes bacterium]|nr:phosphoribosylglycinamide formyltransferase [Armatimonadota bacterium]